MDSNEHIEAHYLVSLRELTEDLAIQAKSAADLAQYFRDAAKSLVAKWSVFQNYQLRPHPLSDSLAPTRNRPTGGKALDPAESSSG